VLASFENISDRDGAKVSEGDDDSILNSSKYTRLMALWDIL